MKSLKDYLIIESIDKNTAISIAQALVDKGNQGHYSFWTDTEYFTGKYKKYTDLDKFEKVLVKDLANTIMSYNDLSSIDPEEFTNNIKYMYVGDGAQETDFGDNAYDEILDYVEEVFKEFNIGASQPQSTNQAIIKYKKSNIGLSLYISPDDKDPYISFRIIPISVKGEYVIYKSFAETQKYSCKDNCEFVSYLANQYILTPQDGIDLLQEIIKLNGKIKIYDYLGAKEGPGVNRNKMYRIGGWRGKSMSIQDLENIIQELKDNM